MTDHIILNPASSALIAPVRRVVFGAVTLLTVSVLTGCAPPQNLVGIETVVPSETVEPKRKLKVYVATSRAPSEEPGELFSGKRGQQLRFASVDVSIPPNHEEGKIERPRQLPSDPRKHFVIEDPINFEDRRSFQADLSNNLMKQPISDRNVLLFVHGYNTNLTSAILQVSQFVEDTGYEGVPLLFSWASSGETVKYVYDINSALVARDGLVSLYDTLRLPAIQSYDLVAHSMGTFLVMEASRQVALTTGVDPTGKVKNVVLAAPDIDIDLFATQLSSLPREDRNIVVLVSKDDKALRASRRVAGGVTRVGLAPAEELSRLGVIAIDLSEVDDTSSFSHNKFKNSPAVAQLLGNSMQEGSSFNQAPNLSLTQSLRVGVDGTLRTIGAVGR